MAPRDEKEKSVTTSWSNFEVKSDEEKSFVKKKKKYVYLDRYTVDMKNNNEVIDSIKNGLIISYIALGILAICVFILEISK